MKQSILITGCSSGIGYTCAHALKDKGYQVIASCRKQEDVNRLRNEGLETLQLDLADRSSIERAVEEVRRLTGGKLYALFNNGAYGQPGALEDLSTDALREQFEVNVFGWHHLTKAILPMMRANSQGRIIQNSSVLGIVAMRYRGAYNASKFAIEGWTDTLRLELAGTGIHICLIEPGPIHSRFRANALEMFHKHITLSGSATKLNTSASWKGLARRHQPIATPCRPTPSSRHYCMLWSLRDQKFATVSPNQRR